MLKKSFLFLLIFVIGGITVFSQEFYRRDISFVDTSTTMIWASPNFSVQLPFGTGYLASTFNYNCNIGLDFTIKTKSNWTFDFAFNYMFGSKLRKTPKEILGDMAIFVSDSSTYPIFNGNGDNSVRLSYEGRYWYFGATAGKIFALDRWKNSGLWLKFGIGYFGHKISFTDPYDFFPQIDLKTHYRYGYDQRSSGVALNQFFGYLFMQKRRVLSFYVGIEVWEIFSKPDRGYIFAGDLAGSTDKLPRKFSGLLGIKVGWILPFYEKKRITTLYTY